MTSLYPSNLQPEEEARLRGSPEIGLYYFAGEPNWLFLHRGCIGIPWKHMTEGSSVFIPTFHSAKQIRAVVAQMAREYYGTKANLAVRERIEYGYMGVRLWYLGLRPALNPHLLRRLRPDTLSEPDEAN